ncbi:MAG TPA: LLM class flavin-dependent oxidoreductase [Streptosporangiaceae bacterium]
MSRTIRFNAFEMTTPALHCPGLWRHPGDQSWRYKDLSYWSDLARLLERGIFDGIFIADVLGVYDVYRGTPDAALASATQVPVNDPLLMVSALAQVTEHLGFGITASTSFEHPYPFARRMSTLDHLTRGRIGWNIVTSYLDSGARNVGQSGTLDHDQRYEYADEYMEVLYKLWEASWDDDAVVRDAAANMFVDPSRVRPIRHEGQYFSVPGIHLCEPSPQRTPLLYQAGTSGRGKKFAVDHAESIFVSAPTTKLVRGQVADVRNRLEAAGRDRGSIVVYSLCTIITGETGAAAQAKYDDYRRYADYRGVLASWSGFLGHDLGAYDLDDPIEHIDSNAARSLATAITRDDPDLHWTVRDLAAWGALGGPGPVATGSPAQVADQLQEWAAETDVDGFNVTFAVRPDSFADIVEYVVPELQRRGVYPASYQPGTLRDKLFGAGPRLPGDHRGASYRPARVAGAATAPSAAS